MDTNMFKFAKTCSEDGHINTNLRYQKPLEVIPAAEPIEFIIIDFLFTFHAHEAVINMLLLRHI